MTKRERRPRGRPESKAKATRGRRKTKGSGPERKAQTRAKKRADIFERQAAHGMRIDDLDHSDTEVPLHLLAKGKILKRYLMCGKENCVCRTRGKKHGPYFYLVVNVPASMRRRGDPKQRWFYLTKEEAQRFKARISNFKALVNNMFSDMWEELNTR